MNTKQIGDIAEAAVTAALLKAGKNVLIPFGDRNRYDVALDEGGKLVRLQVKSGWRRGGVLEFNTSSSTRQKGKRVETHYFGQIDYFAVYDKQTDRIYIVPVAIAPRGSGRLRLDSPKLRGNKKSIKFAKDYIFNGTLA